MAKIVIMDDSDFQRRVICKVVKSEGHEVIEGRNGLDGLYRIATHWPDCILCDLVMPEIDGFGVLNRLQSNGIDIPLIVITADVQNATRLQCQQLGAKGFINKPVDESQVLETLRLILKQDGKT